MWNSRVVSVGSVLCGGRGDDPSCRASTSSLPGAASDPHVVYQPQDSGPRRRAGDYKATWITSESGTIRRVHSLGKVNTSPLPAGNPTMLVHQSMEVRDCVSRAAVLNACG